MTDAAPSDDDRALYIARGKRTILWKSEAFWRDHYDWLQDSGYLLRDRYKPDWVPSWRGEADNAWKTAEDGAVILDGRVGDAVRLSDGAFVALKKVDSARSPHELAMATEFNTPPLVNDSRNRCVPVYDILKVPDREDYYLLVMPLLRTYDGPPWDSIGEIIALWQQMFEGLHFMHMNHVAHRDCSTNNIMLDPRTMYPKSFHPAAPHLRRDFTGPGEYFTRTERPPRYYLIDLGLSEDYGPVNGLPRAYPVYGGDKSVPKFSDHPHALYDPYATDVYYLGNWIKEEFVKKYYGFTFIQDLVADMTHRDPAKRPTMEEALARFDRLAQGRSSWWLRSRVVKRVERDTLDAARRAFEHWKRKVLFTIAQTSAIPQPEGGR